MTRLRVERLCRIQRDPACCDWLAWCGYCEPPLDRVPFKASTVFGAAEVLGEHLTAKHPQLNPNHTPDRAETEAAA